MKTILLGAIISLLGIFGTVSAEETMGEQIQDQTNDMMRKMQKGAHRMEEAVCIESDAECLKEKAKNRAEEASDAVEDKATELKNKVD